MSDSQELSFLETQAFAYWRIFEGAKAAVLANPGIGMDSENARCTLRFVDTHIAQLPDHGPFFTLLKTYTNLFCGFYFDLKDQHDFADAIASLGALMRDKFHFWLRGARRLSDGEKQLAIKTVTGFLLGSDLPCEFYGPEGIVSESTLAMWLRDFGIEGPSATRRAANKAAEAAMRLKLIGEESTP